MYSEFEVETATSNEVGIMLVKLNKAFIIYQHEQMFEGCITTTVFDTNLTYQKNIPYMRILKIGGVPYNTDDKCTVAMLGWWKKRLDEVHWK